MSNRPKNTEIKLNSWDIGALALIVFFFRDPLLVIGGGLTVGWLIYRNRTKIWRFLNEITGKNRRSLLTMSVLRES